ncbi:MAG: gamma-glutamyltransferase [Gammaproteobacteria bacterium]|nr:gamma-glutamyltransferase [Gammaproteobacteria bacterium]
MRTVFALIVLLVGLTACTSQLPDPAVPATSAAVAMPDSYAAEVAEDILQAGGNAVDAAIASALVLAVTYPEAGNIGGGGFMLVYMDGRSDFLDYRETAPGTASRDMYLDESGEVISDLSLVGHLAAGVPGTVAGLWEAHRRYGTRPWSELVEPALRLARDGFVMSAHLAARIGEFKDEFDGRTNFAAYFGAARPGVLFRQPELADTLGRIARQGADGFYRGTTATHIAAEMTRGGGLISANDLASYKAVWREPLATPWRGYQLVSAPPPSSGGFAVIQLLHMKDYLADAFTGLAHNSPQYIHLVAEMEKRVFADRAEYFGDPDFVDVPIDKLIDPSYLRKRAAAVNTTSISSVASVPPGLEAHDTTHFSVVDQWGNAVSNTYTLNGWFGSGVVVEGAGFLLNNEMDDFSAKPGVPNFYGVVGNSANAIAPGKRMLSSMSPTILLRDNKVSMVVGTPGGSTIFTSVFQAIVNILDFGMTPQQAVAASRFHHQLLPPDLITFSPGVPLDDETINVLGQRGYRAEPHPWVFGDLQVIWYANDRVLTGADPRGRGTSGLVSAP